MTAVEALAAAVTAEHQAVYGYGLAGARLAGADRAAAVAALDAHRTRRDQLAALMARRAATPPPAAAAYATPPIRDRASARTLCAALEDGCAGAAWDLVAAAAPASPERTLAVAWLGTAAETAAAWRSGVPGWSAPALPGQPS